MNIINMKKDSIILLLEDFMIILQMKNSFNLLFNFIRTNLHGKKNQKQVLKYYRWEWISNLKILILFKEKWMKLF